MAGKGQHVNSKMTGYLSFYAIQNMTKKLSMRKWFVRACAICRTYYVSVFQGFSELNQGNYWEKARQRFAKWQ